MLSNIDWAAVRKRAITILQTIIVVASTILGYIQVAPTPPAPNVSVQVVTPDGKATSIPTATFTVER